MDGLSFWTELEMRPPEFGKILLKVYDHFCDSRAPKTEMPNKQGLAFFGGVGGGGTFYYNGTTYI